MRSVTTEVVNGRILLSGVVAFGPMSCVKESTGRYRLYSPPGKRLTLLLPIPTDPAVWLLVQSAQITERNGLIVFANENGTANVDSNFTYMAMFVV